MKLIKKLVSCTLALCLVLTLTPAAMAAVTVTPQEENYSFSMYNEVFDGDSVPTGMSCGYNDSYRTKTTASVEDNALKITAEKYTGTSGSNYGDLRIAYNPYLTVKNEKFDISYDICFKTFDASTADKTILKMSAVTQNGGWNINREIFKIKANNTDSVYLIGASSGSLNVGEWYNVKHVFDVASGKEYVTVSNESGIVTTATVNANNVTEIRRFNFAFLQPSEILFDNIDISSGSMLISGLPSSGARSEDINFDAVIPEGFDEAAVLIDGEAVSTFEYSEGKNRYTVTIPADTLKAGNHVITVTANFGGTILTAEDSISVVKVANKPILKADGSEVSVATENFNKLVNSSGAVMNDEVGYTEIKWNASEATTIWQTNANAFMIPGPSGEDTDYGIMLKNNSNLIQIKGVGGDGAASSGKFVMDFDLYIEGDNVSIKMSPQMARPDSSSNFVGANKLFGKLSLTSGEWTHVNMVYDFTESLWTVRAGDEETTYSAASLTNKSFSEIRFTLYSADSVFAFDNVSVYNIKYYEGVKRVTYIAEGEESELGAIIPANTESVKLYVNEPLDASTLDGNVYVRDSAGVFTEDITAVYSEDDGAVTITPDNSFPVGRSVDVILSKDVKYADGTVFGEAYTARTKVQSDAIITNVTFTVDGKELTSASQLVPGAKVAAAVSCEGIFDGTAEASYILSLRKKSQGISQLVSLSYDSVALALGDSALFDLEIPKITDEGEYELYLMIIDDFENSNAKAEYIIIK